MGNAFVQQSGELLGKRCHPDSCKQSFCVKHFVETLKGKLALAFTIIQYQCIFVLVSAGLPI